jgi:acetyl esterase/lipase
MHGFQEQLLLKGIASASINYRYVSANVHYPDLMNDVNAALHFCQTKAAEWEIRNNKYLIGGASAGGHMALLYAYSYNQDNLISGVISAAGPTDFTDEVWMNYAASIGLMPAINFLANSTYTVPVDSQFVAASPVQNLKNVPTLMLHGDEDEVVFYSQSQRLSTALQQAGIQQKLYTIHGGKHDMGLTNPTIFGNLLKEMTEWIQEFGK